VVEFVAKNVLLVVVCSRSW